METNASTIEFFGLNFTPLREDHIEFIRKWRNKEEILSKMIYRQTISQKKQQEWFRNNQKNKNHYFVVERNKEIFGLINIKDVNTVNKTGEAGIMMFRNQKNLSRLSVKACFFILNFGFETLKLNKIVIKVLKSNFESLNFVVNYGFVFVKNEDQEYVNGYLHKNVFRKVKPRFLNIFDKF